MTSNFYDQTYMRFHSAMATLEPQSYVVARTVRQDYPDGQRRVVLKNPGNLLFHQRRLFWNDCCI